MNIEINSIYRSLVGTGTFSHRLKCINGKSYYKYRNEDIWKEVSNPDYWAVQYINGISEENKQDILSGKLK